MLDAAQYSNNNNNNNKLLTRCEWPVFLPFSCFRFPLLAGCCCDNAAAATPPK